MSSTSWSSPSNIALVKYWGKHGRQLPKNPSISFTLSEAKTTTSVMYEELHLPTVEFLYQGKKKEEFAPRVIKFIASLKEEFEFLKTYSLQIDSSNSFPHSSGIASSASFMSSLALCLCEIESRLYSWDIDLHRVSHIARLGSGSASRSLFPHAAAWGSSAAIAGSSDLYAVELSDIIDPVFKTWRDDILIVSKDKKSVSSSLGHSLMDDNPYSEVRYAQARINVASCLDYLRAGDQWALGVLIEAEAMVLHGLMMSSTPGYMLIEPNTIQIMREVRRYRKAMKLPLFFSLDAGPNIHLMYPESIAGEVAELKKSVLMGFCLSILDDKVGLGPKNLTLESDKK